MNASMQKQVVPSENNFKLSRLFALSAAPPHATIEVDARRREITVLARRDRENSKGAYVWVFGVPADGALGEISTRYKGGALEIIIPKHNMAICA